MDPELIKEVETLEKVLRETRTRLQMLTIVGEGALEETCRALGECLPNYLTGHVASAPNSPDTTVVLPQNNLSHLEVFADMQSTVLHSVLSKDHQESFKDHQESFKDHQESFKDHQESFKDHQESFKDHQESFKDHQESFNEQQTSFSDQQSGFCGSQGDILASILVT